MWQISTIQSFPCSLHLDQPDKRLERAWTLKNPFSCQSHKHLYLHWFCPAVPWRGRQNTVQCRGRVEHQLISEFNVLGVFLFTPGFTKPGSVCSFTLCGMLNQGVAFLTSVLRHQQEQCGDTLGVTPCRSTDSSRNTVLSNTSPEYPTLSLLAGGIWRRTMEMFSYRKVSPDRISWFIQRSHSVGPVPLTKHTDKEKLQNFGHWQWFGSGCSYIKEESFVPSQI